MVDPDHGDIVHYNNADNPNGTTANPIAHDGSMIFEQHLTNGSIIYTTTHADGSSVVRTEFPSGLPDMRDTVTTSSYGINGELLTTETIYPDGTIKASRPDGTTLSYTTYSGGTNISQTNHPDSSSIVEITQADGSMNITIIGSDHSHITLNRSSSGEMTIARYDIHGSLIQLAADYNISINRFDRSHIEVNYIANNSTTTINFYNNHNVLVGTVNSDGGIIHDPSDYFADHSDSSTLPDYEDEENEFRLLTGELANFKITGFSIAPDDNQNLAFNFYNKIREPIVVSAPYYAYTNTSGKYLDFLFHTVQPNATYVVHTRISAIGDQLHTEDVILPLFAIPSAMPAENKNSYTVAVKFSVHEDPLIGMKLYKQYINFVDNDGFIVQNPPPPDPLSPPIDDVAPPSVVGSRL